jgi:hypothetical protein
MGVVRHPITGSAGRDHHAAVAMKSNCNHLQAVENGEERHQRHRAASSQHRRSPFGRRRPFAVARVNIKAIKSGICDRSTGGSLGRNGRTCDPTGGTVGGLREDPAKTSGSPTGRAHNNTSNEASALGISTATEGLCNPCNGKILKSESTPPPPRLPQAHGDSNFNNCLTDPKSAAIILCVMASRIHLSGEWYLGRSVKVAHR